MTYCKFHVTINLRFIFILIKIFPIISIKWKISIGFFTTILYEVMGDLIDGFSYVIHNILMAATRVNGRENVPRRSIRELFDEIRIQDFPPIRRERQIHSESSDFSE